MEVFLVLFCGGDKVWDFVSLRFRIIIKQVYLITCFLKTELCNSL